MMKSQSGVFEVPVELNKVLKISFIFDSGASDVSISPDVTGTWVIYLGNVDGASPSWQEAAGAFTFTLRPT